MRHTSSHPRQPARPRRAPAGERPPRRTRGQPATRKANRHHDPAIPTPEQWAREQLKNAPDRSRRWAREVAAIYGLDIAEE
ncbi:MAG: hypothetical protein LC808_00360 [Actinobacteria bacterium]|nr:hypothetical protein [Actinomycetota bacterium]